VLARNKIVHNSGMVREPALKKNRKKQAEEDQAFVDKWPEYVDGDRITITKKTFEENVTRSLAFIDRVTGGFDRFVELLAVPTSSRPS